MGLGVEPRALHRLGGCFILSCIPTPRSFSYRACILFKRNESSHVSSVIFKRNESSHVSPLTD